MERTVRTQRSLSKQEGGEWEEPRMFLERQDSGRAQVQQQLSGEEQETQPAGLHRSRSQNKVKLLVRSHAVREEASPPRDPPVQNHSQEEPQLVRQDSQGRRHSRQTDWLPPLSRGNSREQYEGNPVDLQQFIVDTLNKNHKDRMLLLKIESELLNLVNDPKRTMHKFAQMSSYQRMLVHRVAAYFCMDHNVDTSGVSVIVNTTKATRIPDTRFREFVRDDLLLTEEPRRSILKRDSSSFDETGSFKNGERMIGGDSRRSKSFEEREEEYEKARRRIFNRHHSVDGDGDCLEELGGWGETDDPIITASDTSLRSDRGARLLKVESYESGEALRANSLRLSVSKSHSFNGYEPPQQTQMAATRVLTKQDSGSSMSSRISPSSSGYKSQRSDATLSATPSPTATPSLHTQLSAQSTGCALSPQAETVVWAVSDLSSVPPGSMLIHPQSGQPYTNPDGTIYHYDPANPPRVVAEGVASNGGQPQVAGTATTGVAKQQQQQHESCEGLEQHQEDPGGKLEAGGSIYESSGYLSPPQYHQGGGHQQPVQYHPGTVQYQHPYQHQHPHHHQHHQHRIHTQESMGEAGGGGDLSQYMMGLSLEGHRQPPPPSDTRQLLYWPSTHHMQGQTSGETVYYSGTGTTPGGPQRYQPQPGPPHTYLPGPHQLPSQPHITTQHPGGCYTGASGYGASPPECVPYTPSSAVHMYYTPPSYTSGQTGGQTVVGGGTPGYYSNMAPPNCPGSILVQYPQPCPHPTPPHTPQGVCGQLAMYNGCYPAPHYATSASTLPVPAAQLFRKPALQVGVRCSSPLRGQYPASPTIKERPPEEKVQPIPFYGLRVIPGDVRILGNSRLPFALLPPPKGLHPRKHRSRLGGRPQDMFHPAGKA